MKEMMDEFVFCLGVLTVLGFVLLGIYSVIRVGDLIRWLIGV